MRDGARSLLRFAPPIAWMGVIAVLSSGLFGADRTAWYLYELPARFLPWAIPEVLSGLHVILRKLAHVVEYGILAGLWWRALAPDRPDARAAGWAIALAAAYALVDEARQGLAPTRTPSLHDVALDTGGACLAIAALRGSGPLARTVLRVARGVVLALAAASLMAAVADWSLGLPAADLAVAALGLVGLTWALGRLARA